MNNYKYELAKTDDESSFDIEKQNIELTNLSDDFNCSICSICLIKNDSNSICLECGCVNKFHIKCVEILKKNKINNCPICKNNIKTNNYMTNKNIESYRIFFNNIFNLMSVFFIITNLTFFVVRVNDISKFKYCVINQKKCEYLPAIGELYNNKINKKLNNFKVEYELLSSYNYTLDSKIYTCKDLETHVYNSYNEILYASKESIGLTKKIYHNKNYLDKCSLNLEWYNCENIYSGYILLAIFGLYMSLIITTHIFDCLKSKNINNKYVNVIILSIYKLLHLNIVILSILLFKYMKDF